MKFADNGPHTELVAIAEPRRCHPLEQDTFAIDTLRQQRGHPPGEQPVFAIKTTHEEQ